MYLIASEIITSAGFGKEALWKSLTTGQNHSQPGSHNLIKSDQDFSNCKACLMKDYSEFRSNSNSKNFKNRYGYYFNKIWSYVLEELSGNSKNKTALQGQVGLIFTSTKGCLEDYVWTKEFENFDHNLSGSVEIVNQFDAFNPILDQFVTDNLSEEQANYKTENRIVISHACTSTQVGLQMAKYWLDSKTCDSVILLSGDLIGPFVFKGFASLKILTENENRPFDKDRDGLQLGEACAVFIFSNQVSSTIKITAVETISEPTSISRPNIQGHGLTQAILNMKNKVHFSPDLIIAHGTGTKFNDLAEDTVFKKLEFTAPVTGVKWSIGHTLGASGACDLIAAEMVLKKQKYFNLEFSKNLEESTYKNYLLSNKNFEGDIRQVMTTSLGFGGINGALLVEKVSNADE